MFNILNVPNVKGVCMPSVYVFVCVCPKYCIFISQCTIMVVIRSLVIIMVDVCIIYITNTILTFCIINTFL